MAHKKGVGSTKNGRDSAAQRLGTKRADGQFVLTRHDVGATLTDQDVAGQNELAICTLRAQTLSRRITAVLGRTHTFFMSEQLNVNL